MRHKRGNETLYGLLAPILFNNANLLWLFFLYKFVNIVYIILVIHFKIRLGSLSLKLKCRWI